MEELTRADGLPQEYSRRAPTHPSRAEADALRAGIQHRGSKALNHSHCW